MIRFTLNHPKATQEMLGYIPTFLSEADPRPAAIQIDNAYQHGGGWRPFHGFTVSADATSINYPGDPPMKLIATARLHEEVLRLYESEWLSITQPDGSVEICRMD